MVASVLSLLASTMSRPHETNSTVFPSSTDFGCWLFLLLRLTLFHYSPCSLFLLPALSLCCRTNLNPSPGCWNDVTNVSRYLQERGFTDMRQMTDREQETSNNYPNRANMIAAFQWLMADMQAGDSFVFHYSGTIFICCLGRKAPVLSGYVF
jgi:hypothetical protein